MKSKQEKAKEYSDYLHKEIEEYYGRKCAPKDMYYKYSDIRDAFETGWDEALKSQWVKVEEKLPQIDKKVFVLVEYRGMIQIHTFKYFGETNWYFGDSKVIAWMPIPSFDEILEANKDVLKRLKEN